MMKIVINLTDEQVSALEKLNADSNKEPVPSEEFATSFCLTNIDMIVEHYRTNDIEKAKEKLHLLSDAELQAILDK